MNKIIFVLIPLLFLSYKAESQLSIIGPNIVADELKTMYENLSIPNMVGNFGAVPYGKTVIGYVTVQKQSDQTNYWCDSQESTISDTMQVPYEKIILVDHSTKCHYATKAYNVRQAGGKMMLLISDTNNLSEQHNTSDPIGLLVDIPTVIIPKNVGEVFKKYLENQTQGMIILALKFSGVAKSGLELDFFFRSDDVKALSFFKEFGPYMMKLHKNVTFVPVYKYNIYDYEETNDLLETKKNKAPCVKAEKYCTGLNTELHISNPRLVLMENIRQSCIFELTSLYNYWSYMMIFMELCADINNPTFTEDCSVNTLKTVGLIDKKDEITQCMTRMIKENSKINADYASYNEKKIFKVPDLLINGVKYRGNWNGKSIFNAICEGFIDDEEICRKLTPDEAKSNRGIGIFFTVIVVLAVTMFIFLFCYRRLVNRSLEESVRKRIQDQTMFALEKYQGISSETGATP